jgi:hypothetical protein
VLRRELVAEHVAADEPVTTRMELAA